MSGNKSRSRSEPLTTIDDLAVGDVVYDVDSWKILEVVAIDYEVADGPPEGTITFRQKHPDSAPGDDAPVDWNAEDVDYKIHEGRLRAVPQRVLEEPAAVASEFVGENLNGFLSHHGPRHDYNGIDGVNVVGDLFVAQELADRRRQQRGARITSEDYESQTACPQCNYRVRTLYRLETDEVAVCGGCFAANLMADEVDVVR